MDELGHILDRIDVMMRRWANEPHARCGVTQLGDILIDLASWEFAPFAWLGALDDFDLDFIRIGKIPTGHAETPRSHLFDRRTLGVPTFKRLEADRVFASFSGVGFASESIHCDGERLVTLR